MTKRNCILLGLGVVLFLGLTLFAYGHRSYPSEVAIIIDDLRGDGAVSAVQEPPSSLGIYYILYDAAALEPEVSQEEAAMFEQQWVPPRSVDRDDHPVAIPQDGLRNHARWVMTGDERFLERTLHGKLIEEYPGSGSMPHVLNGSVFDLLGLYDLALVTEDSDQVSEFDTLAANLAAHLDDYDTGEWTHKHIGEGAGEALSSYHRVHIAQAEAMYVLTGD